MPRWVRWITEQRADLAVALIVLVVAVPIVQPLRAQQASRLALTAAIWDGGTIRIDDYPLGVDRAEREGHTYSDKAPGQPLFALPAYGLYRIAGGEPALVQREVGNLGLWAVSVWSSALPAAALAVLLRRAAARVAPEVSTAVAVSLATGTLLLPFSTLLFGHVLSTALALGAWLLVTDRPPSRSGLAVAGFLAAASVATEYSLIGAAVAIAAVALHRCRTRAWPFAVGAAIPAAGLLAYQAAAFGSPWQISYASSSFTEEAAKRGIVQSDADLLHRAGDALVGGRGLLTLSPLLALGAIGLVRLVRRETGEVRWGYAAAGIAAASVTAVQMAWGNPTGGDSPGARYATTAAAFLAPGVALLWRRARRLSVVLAAIGTSIMLAATVTEPIIPKDADGVVRHWFDELLAGRWGTSVFSMAWGDAGRGVQLAVGVAGAVAAWQLTPRRGARASGP